MIQRRCGKAKKGVAHESHFWIAGVYFPIGEVDGYPARCPGVAEGAAVGNREKRKVGRRRERTRD